MSYWYQAWGDKFVMNKKILLEYIHQSLEIPRPTTIGPVITVSREYGCPGIPLTDQLTEALNKESDDQSKWQKFDKEIIEQAADELSLPSDMVENVIKEKNPGLFFDLIAAFSDHYVPNDFKVKRKVAAIITSVAHRGHAVILGRAGEVLTQHIEKSLHIRLMAPKEVRLQRIKELFKYGDKEAERVMKKVQLERTYLRNYYSGDRVNAYFYDLTFNTTRLTVPVMVSSIMEIVRARGLL